MGELHFLLFPLLLVFILFLVFLLPFLLFLSVLLRGFSGAPGGRTFLQNLVQDQAGEKTEVRQLQTAAPQQH